MKRLGWAAAIILNLRLALTLVGYANSLSDTQQLKGPIAYPQSEIVGLTGAELWKVGGKDWTVSCSYFVRRGKEVVYVIESPYPNPSRIKSIDQAIDIVFPVMQRAMEDRRLGAWKSLTESADGSAATYIQVFLFERRGTFEAHYSVPLSVEKIKSRMAGFPPHWPPGQ